MIFLLSLWLTQLHSKLSAKSCWMLFSTNCGLKLGLFLPVSVSNTIFGYVGHGIGLCLIYFSIFVHWFLSLKYFFAVSLLCVSATSNDCLSDSNCCFVFDVQCVYVALFPLYLFIFRFYSVLITLGLSFSLVHVHNPLVFFYV